MKRKIVIGLLVQTALFLVGGLYLANRIRTATDDVTGVVRLHQVEHLRENYLLHLNAVQSDLARESTRHARAPRVVSGDVAALSSAIDRCFRCHHSDASTRRLAELKGGTDRYRAALDLLAAAPPGSAERAAASAIAFRLGGQLIALAADTIEVTSRDLERHTLDTMEDLSRTRRVLYALVLLGPLLSAVAGVFFVTSLTRPFDALLAATHKLRSGELDHRVVGLQDEFGQLAASFNEMARSLQAQFQLMQRTEQLVVVGELAAGLVHEIKNPLAGIKGAVQLLSREADLAAEDRAVLERVGREVSALDGLLRAFLGFAKPARPQLAEVDVNELVESVVAFYARTHAPDHAHAIRIVRALGPVPPARLDPMQLQQVLLNLLLNAVDAMPGGGVIEVRTAFDERIPAIRIELADSGRGISAEHAPRVFQPFFTTKARGTGLGLAVSKRLVEQQGGAIGFAPRPGGGTVFRIELPPAPAPIARSA